MTTSLFLRLGVVALCLWVPPVVAGQQVFDTFDPPPCSPLGRPTGGCVAGVRHPIRVVQVASGIVQPRHLAFLPDGRTMLIAEIRGNVRIVRDGTLDAQPIAGWPVSEFEVRQLHTVVPHPRFADTQWVYLSYTKGRADGMTTAALARGRLNGTTLSEVREIFVADAWLMGGPIGTKAAFGPDGTIYMAIDDHDRLRGTADSSVRMGAQNLATHAGKVVRLRDDGTVPPDNPFVGRQGAKPEIFTYGHRTVTGFAWDPAGQMWSVEIGPLGGDELNVLLPGRNYGWPLVSLGRNYPGSLVSEQPYSRPGMEDPRMFWVPSISPYGVMVYTGDRFPWWRGDIFVGALNGQQLQRVAFNQPSPQQAEFREVLLTQLDRRFRAVVQGPDGFIYVLTEQDFPGAGPPPPGAAPPPPRATGVIFRIEPAE